MGGVAATGLVGTGVGAATVVLGALGLTLADMSSQRDIFICKFHVSVD